jgi:hypothetical protein
MSLRRTASVRWRPRVGPVSTVALLVASLAPGVAGETRQSVLRFAAEMAQRGNWREASFRWETLIERASHDPFVLNNLGVAAEALGEPVQAGRRYRRALALAPGNERIEDNLLRFERFWREHPAGQEAMGEGEVQAPIDKALMRDIPATGKPLRVTVSLPVPPRLDTTGYDTLLVASFLTDENTMIDVNRELVRFLRGKLQKDPDFDVLDVTPAPAIPEQRVEDLIANDGFWRYLGREYGADLIVSGVVGYTREDYSGYEDVDRIDATTGQKVRRSEFVERERFTYAIEVLFMSGETGRLLFRDRLQRSAVYRGSANDPITAFHDLTDALTPDLMAIVEPRTREDVRVIFKK